MAAQGPKLQQLIDANCITQQCVIGLTQQQADRIEQLSQAQIDTLIAVHQAVGSVPCGEMI